MSTPIGAPGCLGEMRSNGSREISPECNMAGEHHDRNCECPGCGNDDQECLTECACGDYWCCECAQETWDEQQMCDGCAEANREECSGCLEVLTYSGDGCRCQDCERPTCWACLSCPNYICLSCSHERVRLAEQERIRRTQCAVIIQRSWRRCRDEPSYPMCRKIQLCELAELGAIEEGDYVAALGYDIRMLGYAHPDTLPPCVV